MPIILLEMFIWNYKSSAVLPKSLDYKSHVLNNSASYLHLIFYVGDVRHVVNLSYQGEVGGGIGNDDNSIYARYKPYSAMEWKRLKELF